MLSAVLVGIFVTAASVAAAAIINVRQRPTVVSGVTRGAPSWNYIYWTFGFALTIEAEIVALGIENLPNLWRHK
jgi:hypothetical protein